MIKRLNSLDFPKHRDGWTKALRGKGRHTWKVGANFQWMLSSLCLVLNPEEFP